MSSDLHKSDYNYHINTLTDQPMWYCCRYKTTSATTVVLQRKLLIYIHNKWYKWGQGMFPTLQLFTVFTYSLLTSNSFQQNERVSMSPTVVALVTQLHKPLWITSLTAHTVATINSPYCCTCDTAPASPSESLHWQPTLLLQST
jgi:hypothetical protein